MKDFINNYNQVYQFDKKIINVTSKIQALNKSSDGISEVIKEYN